MSLSPSWFRVVLWMGVLVASSPAQAEPNYPVINSDELVKKLHQAGQKLIDSGQAKGTVALRDQLRRETCELTLPVPATERISDKALYRRACQSVFVIAALYKIPDSKELETAMATAFAVTPDGVLSASYHIFDDKEEFDVLLAMDVSGRIYPVQEVLAASQEKDTCLLRIDAHDLRPLPLAEEAAPGTRVRVVSHPSDFFYFMSVGHIGNYFKDNDGLVWMNITADFGAGSSGAPVLDELGNVVGQVNHTLALYSGGPEEADPAERRGKKGVADENQPGKDKPVEEPAPAEAYEPQMIFKTCVPVDALRSLIKVKPISAQKERE